jgi:hypothetical protein
MKEVAIGAVVRDSALRMLVTEYVCVCVYIYIYIYIYIHTTGLEK